MPAEPDRPDEDPDATAIREAPWAEAVEPVSAWAQDDPDATRIAGPLPEPAAEELASEAPRAQDETTAEASGDQLVVGDVPADDAPAVEEGQSAAEQGSAVERDSTDQPDDPDRESPR